MHVTSGTTGRPKGVWSGLLARPGARACVAEERDLWGFAADDVNLVLSPLHHSAPLRFADRHAAGRGPDRASGAVRPEQVTAAIGAERPDDDVLRARRTCSGSSTTGSAPGSRTSPRSGWSRTPAPPVPGPQAPGPRGVPGRVHLGVLRLHRGTVHGLPSEEWLERPGTVGRARPGRELSVDADGTIWCRVPAHARFSYWRAPEKTAAAWRGDAFTVGDHGRLDEDGYLYLHGRREDLVITGGVNVYPAEVENALREHPGVDEIAVFGVPDPRWGQRVCAAVVGSASAEELGGFARERLTPPKRPKEFVHVEALPHTATGKLRRLELADRLYPQ